MGARAVRDLAVSKRALTIPARTLDDAVRLCDPFSPLDPCEDAALHEDLSQIRGGDHLAKIARNIRRAGGTPTLHLLSGHIGSGKTTELFLMKKRLESAEGGVVPATTLFLDADAVLDWTDVELEDILVALWSLVYEKAPAAAAKALGPVWKEQIKGILGALLTNLPDQVPDALQKLLGDVRLAGPKQKQKVRAALGSVTTALIEGLNQAFEAIRGTPPNDPGCPLVVMIDNLEKLSEGQRANVERLYLERMVALKQLEAHLVITVPLHLCYAAAGSSLIDLYDGKVVVLPMIEVRKRAAEGDGDNPDGLAAMVHLLKRRVDFDLLFEEGAAAAERIARYSGGCIRHALRLVLDAVNEHDLPKVTTASIHRAAGEIQANFERVLSGAYVPILKQVARNNRFPESCDEQAKQDLLRNLFVLEYHDGELGPWWAVPPLVEQCRKYREHP